MGRKNTPEEAEIRAIFRETRDKLRRQIKDYENSEFKLDEVTDAIKLQYSVVARLEAELEKVPLDEQLYEELENEITTEFNGKTTLTTLPEKTYKALLKRVERLEAKVDRVKLLDMIGKHARLLTQNITASAQIGELQANTKRIELTTHNATLIALAKMFYIAMQRQGIENGVLIKVARELKRLEKDYPLIETDYAVMRKVLIAEPEQIPTIIEDVDYIALENRLEDVNSLVIPKRKGRK